MTEYMSIKIPKVLADKIRDVMIPLGFTSVTDFVLDATRRLLEKIESRTRYIIQKCRWDQHNYKMQLVCTICNETPQHNLRGVKG